MREMKNAFDGLVSRLDMAEKRISVLKDLNRKQPNLKAKRTKDLKKNRTGYPRIVGLLPKV